VLLALQTASYGRDVAAPRRVLCVSYATQTDGTAFIGGDNGLVSHCIILTCVLDVSTDVNAKHSAVTRV
jgi:hypothetical protein